MGGRTRQFQVRFGFTGFKKTAQIAGVEGRDPGRRLGLAIAGHTKPSGRKDRPGADPRDHRLVPAMPRRR